MVLQTRIFFWSITFLQPEKRWIYGIKPPFFWSTTFLEPDFSNHFSRTTFLHFSRKLVADWMVEWFNPSWLYISFQINSDLSLQIVEPATDQLLTWFLENDKVSLYRRKKFGFSKSSMSFIAEMRKNLQQLAVLKVTFLSSLRLYESYIY